MVESLIIEFVQGNFEEFHSSASASPKAMWHYRKVSFETHSRISSEITSKVAPTTAHSTSDATSNEVLKLSRAGRAPCVNVP